MTKARVELDQVMTLYIIDQKYLDDRDWMQPVQLPLDVPQELIDRHARVAAEFEAVQTELAALYDQQREFIRQELNELWDKHEVNYD